MRFALLFLPLAVFSQYVVPFLNVTPSIDGLREDLWNEALRIELGKYIRSLEVLRTRDGLFMLLTLKSRALDYVGKSFYLFVTFGDDCSDFEKMVLIPFKVWRGKGYVFERSGEQLELMGFEGIGLGDHVEMSLDFQSGTLCFRFVDSRTKDVLETQGLRIGR